MFYSRYSRLFWVSFKKKHREKADNPSIRIYVNKIKNRITFKIKTGYHLKLLPPETMNLFGSTKSRISNDKNGEKSLI